RPARVFLLFLARVLAFAFALGAAFLAAILAALALLGQRQALQFGQIHSLKADSRLEILLVIESKVRLLLRFLCQKPEVLARLFRFCGPLERCGSFQAHQPTGVILSRSQQTPNLANG